MNEFIKKSIEKADNILIFAGAGMSADSGLNTFANASKEWRKQYQELMTRHAFEFNSEEAWSFYCNLLDTYKKAEPHVGYYNLLSVLEYKNYFIVTTNIDRLFLKARFLKERIHYPHGLIDNMQCILPCSNELFKFDENKKKCPLCARKLRPNVFLFDDAIERKIYNQTSSKRFRDWIDSVPRNSSTLILELGVGAEGLHNNAIKYTQKLNAKHIVINPFPPTFVLRPKSYIIAKSIKEAFSF